MRPVAAVAQSTASQASSTAAGSIIAAADLRGDPVLGAGRTAIVRAAIGAVAPATAGVAVTAARAGTNVVTQSSNTAVSLAMPGEAGNAAGSSACTRSMTVRRVS